MPKIRIERLHGPPRRKLMEGLREANKPVFGTAQHRQLTITLREGREIVGGLFGWTFIGWLFVAVLWVSADRRHKGFGTKLMRRAESEARRRGVKNVLLDTH